MEIKNTERYRSGHNGPDSKSGNQQWFVGSNPTLSAKSKKRQTIKNCLSFFLIANAIRGSLAINRFTVKGSITRRGRLTPHLLRKSSPFQGAETHSLRQKKKVDFLFTFFF